MAGVYLFSLQTQDIRHVLDLYKELSKNGDVSCQLYGCLGPCDLVLITFKGGHGLNLSKKLKLEIGVRLDAKDKGSSVYYVDIAIPDLEKAQKGAPSWRTLSFVHTEGVLPNGFKTMGMYSYLLPSKQLLWEDSQAIMELRAKGCHTFSLPILPFQEVMNGKEEVPVSIGLTARAKPGHEKNVKTELIKALEEASNDSINNDFLLVNGHYDLIWPYQTEICMRKYLHHIWNTGAPDGLISSYTFIYNLPWPDNMGLLDVDSPKEYRAVPPHPLRVETLVEGHDKTARFRDLDASLKRKMQKSELVKDVEPIRVFIQPGNESPTVSIREGKGTSREETSSPEEIFGVDIVFSLNFREDDLVDDHETDVVFGIACCQKALVIQEAKNIFTDELPRFRHFVYSLRINMGEAAATALAIGRKCQENRDVCATLKYLAREFWPDKEKRSGAFDLNEEDMARLTIALVMIEAAQKGIQPDFPWFNLICEKHKIVEQLVARSETTSGFKLCRRIFFLGRYEELTAKKPSKETMFSVADLFTRLWSYMVEAIQESLSLSRLKGDPAFHFGQCLTFADLEIISSLDECLVKSRDDLITKFLKDWQNDPAFQSKKALEFNTLRTIAHNLFLMKTPDLTSNNEWAYGVKLKASPFYKIEEKQEESSPMGLECLTQVAFEKKTESFWFYIHQYVCSQALEQGIEKPAQYQTFEFLRRINLELDCFDAIYQSLEKKDLEEGSIVSFNVTPWLLFASESKEEVFWPKWRYGNDVFHAYQEAFFAKVVPLVNLIQDKRATPCLELTEGDVVYPGDPKKKIRWDNLWSTLTRLRDQSKGNITVGLDDQLGIGTDVQRMIRMLQMAFAKDFEKVMVKIDGKVIGELIKERGEKSPNAVGVDEDKASRVFRNLFGLIINSLPPLNKDQRKKLVIVCEGYDGFFKEDVAQKTKEHRRIFAKAVGDALDELEKLEGFRPEILLQGA